LTQSVVVDTSIYMYLSTVDVLEISYVLGLQGSAGCQLQHVLQQPSRRLLPGSHDRIPVCCSNVTCSEIFVNENNNEND